MSGRPASLPLQVGIATLAAGSSHAGTADQGSLGAERLTELLEADGHAVLSRIVLPRERETLDSQLNAWCTHPAIDTVMILGGIGLGPRDVTTEALSMVMLREVVGFGETVRRLASEQQPLVALSLRAIAGVGTRTILFALPEQLRLVELLYPRLLGPLCDASQPGSLAALVPGLRAID